MDYNKKALALHKKYRGKIEIKSKVPLATREDLSAAYTPGVGAVCLAIHKDPAKWRELTNGGNLVAVVTDGTAVLGLGNIGPRASLPVMEGKAAIFKEFAGVDAIPLAISTDDVDEIVKFCKNIEPSFAGINLEDISAPRCFAVVEKLEKELDIPVFHDDQDGTAIVVLAALINACRVTGKAIKELKVVINGAGAAGIAIARLLLANGTKDIVLADSKGVVYEGRADLNIYKKKILAQTKRRKIKGQLADAMIDADVFIGVSKAGLVDKNMVKSMAPDPIIFALANPVPEIMPDIAYRAGAAIVGTGRSDFANQINNALVFPGIFRGLLDSRQKKVSVKMKLSASLALAFLIKKPNKNNIIPKVTDQRVPKAVARAISKK